MAADLKTLRVEIAHLAGIEVTGRAQESGGEVEGCVEAELAEYGRGGDQVGLAAVVKGDTNAGLGRIANRFADVQAAPAGCFDPRHLAAEGFERQNVAHIAGLGLAELTASDLQFVIHQEHNARGSHDVSEVRIACRRRSSANAGRAWRAADRAGKGPPRAGRRSADFSGCSAAENCRALAPSLRRFRPTPPRRQRPTHFSEPA